MITLRLMYSEKEERREGFSSDACLYRLISLPHLFPPHWSWVFIGLGGVQGDP
ncbi:MAG: hypothetical protein QW096_11235 [Thermofilaceae archaeon]